MLVLYLKEKVLIIYLKSFNVMCNKYYISVEWLTHIICNVGVVCLTILFYEYYPTRDL